MDDALLTTAGPPVAVAAAGAVATSALVVGHVTDSQTGVGIGGALVTIVVNGQTLIGLTDANGDFRFAVEPGSVTGTIVATGYGSSTFTVTVAAGDTVNVNVASNPPVLPPTGLPGLMNEVEILVPPAGTVTDWEKVTVVGTVLRPSSAVTVNGIAATVVGNRFTAKHVDLAMGANTITATATNVGSPAASKTISAERATTPVLAVTIYSPPDGATVPGSGLVVRGFVSAKSARTALTGGMALPDEGVFVQTEVPLPVGSQSIAVLAQSSDGTQEVSSDLPVTVLSAIEAVRLISEPPAGEAPLSVVFDPQAGVPLSIERVDFDLDGDLEPEALDREFEPVSKLFTQPGPTEARVFLTTTEGVELSASAGVRVLLPPIATQPFASGNPVDLALADDGDLWVLDAAAGRLSRFAPDRSLLTEFGSSGSGSGQLRSPLAVAVAPGGNLYVADTGNDRISVFEPDGSLIREFGGSGSALGELRSPSGVAVAAGVVVVSDTGNGRLQVFALDGTPLNTAPIPDPRGIAFAGELGLSVSSPVVGIRQLSVESNGFLRQRPPDGLQPSRILASVDVASGGSGVLVVDASSRSVVDLMEQVVQRTLYGPAARAPLAVVGSARRDVPSLFVADGAQVFEVELPVPSPLPTVAAFKTALAAGDANAALPMIFPLQREDYRQIFAALGASLGPLHGQQLGNATIEYLDERRAVVLIETTVEGANGPELRRIPMQLVRKPSGGWQVYEY